MSRPLFPLLTVLALAACGGSSDAPADTLTFAVPEARTIAATDDGVLVPGLLSVGDARPRDGDWLVLDNTERTLHRLSGDLEVLASTAGEGDGPGELHSPAGIVELDSVVGVVGRRARRLDLFDDSLRFLGRAALEVPECPVGLTHMVVDTGDGAPLLVLRCVRFGGGRWVLARLRPAEGGPGGPGRTGMEIGVEVLGEMPAPRRIGLAIDPIGFRWRGRGYLGTVAEGCLDAVTSPRPGGPSAPSRVCHPHDHPVTIPDSLIGRATRALDRLGGPLVEFPEVMPPVIEVTGTELGPLLRVVSDRERGAVADLLGPEGLVLRLQSPDGAVYPSRGGVLLAVTRLEGVELHLFPWEGDPG